MINVSFQIMVSRIIELVPHRHTFLLCLPPKTHRYGYLYKIKIITKQPDKKLYQKVLLSELNQTNRRNLLPVILLKKKNNIFDLCEHYLK